MYKYLFQGRSKFKIRWRTVLTSEGDTVTRLGSECQYEVHLNSSNIAGMVLKSPGYPNGYTSSLGEMTSYL